MCNRLMSATGRICPVLFIIFVFSKFGSPGAKALCFEGPKVPGENF